MQHAVIKFYTAQKDQTNKNSLLLLSITLPFLIIILILLPGYFFFKQDIFSFISSRQYSMEAFSLTIIAIAVATAYFEIFVNWLRVKHKTMVGHFLKEVYPRLWMGIILLLFVLSYLDFTWFIVVLLAGYYLRLLLIAAYAFVVCRPRLTVNFFSQKKLKTITKYSFVVFLSGTAASLIIDIDKSMLAFFSDINLVAYYTVALFIAAVIELPGRAMFQITAPLIAKSINENKWHETERLLKKSALNLLIISGLIFLLVNLNLTDFYRLMENKGYEKAMIIVLLLSFGKLFNMSSGCLNQILSNSKHYNYVFWISTGSALLAILLNYFLIQYFGIVGAGLSTLFVMILSNLAKVILIWKKEHLHPYSINMIYTCLLMGSCALVFGWVEFSSTPFWSIVFKSAAIATVFIFFISLFNLSPDISKFRTQLLKHLN